jgi:GR25 family glycosyltransferase involved in LPS biosynthesis
MQGNKKINDYFDNIYCLNRDGRPDRWSNMTAKFDNLDLKVQRFSAYDSGSELVIEKFKNEKKGSRIRNIGEMGCLISHYKIIEDAIDKKYKSILVFEDDAIFHKEFSTRIKILEELPPWDVLLLGCSELKFKTIKKELVGKKYYKPTHSSYGAFAYAIKDHIFKELLEEYKNFKYPADVNLMKIFKRNKAYILYPNLVIANLTDSNIRPAYNQSEESINRGWDLSEYDI